MNKQQLIFIVLTLSFFLFGCQEKIDIDNISKTERLVVNSTNLVGRPFTFDVSLSSASQGNFARVENAEIKLFGQSGLIEIIAFHPNFNRYQSSFLPVSNTTYYINVALPDGEFVSASTFTPQPIEIFANPGVEFEVGSNTYLQVDVAIPRGEILDSYYLVNGYSTIQKTDGSGSFTSTSQIITNDASSTNQIISDISNVQFSYLFFIGNNGFSSYDTENYELSCFLNINATHVLKGIDGYEAENKVYVKAYSVSEGLYNYLFSLEQFRFNSGASTVNIEGQETIIQTNIENGLGVFGAFTSDTIQIR